ncbi:MAG: acetoin utilization protein AcuC, partial [Chloroflexota bacterium]
MKAAFIYDRQQSEQGFGPSHPLQSSPLHYVYELLRDYKAFEPGSLLSPRPASREELLTFHTEEYVQAVERLSRGETVVEGERYNLAPRGDNPPYLGMYEAASLIVGASIIAAQLISTGQMDRAFNPAGGLHHAAPDHASGFCVFNDPVIAIKYFLNLGWRVAYVDIDAHHGDGVQNAYYDSDQVL